MTDFIDVSVKSGIHSNTILLRDQEALHWELLTYA